MNFIRETPNHFNLPRRITRISELAYNLWWVWNQDAQRLFAQIDHYLWEKVYHNPVAFLRHVDRPNLNAVTNDRYYLELYDQVMRQFDQYMSGQDTWYDKNKPTGENQLVAYFSFEFGLHESLPVYAGGLGILSGDHLKEASDMNLPLVGIGFYYTQGYFSQKITEDGWQETRNQIMNYEELPVVRLTRPDGSPLMISVTLAGRKVFARVLLVQVGRVPLYLLDTDVDLNNSSDRLLTARLYSSDHEMRISQEILLGIGGVRALRELGYQPTVWHMNEGHSAFLTLERMRELMPTGCTYEQAIDQIRQTNIFTTHTPVPAGNDEFAVWLVDKYLSHIWAEMKINREQFVGLGRNAQDWGETFSMPVLALHLSGKSNAVSELHGRVSRKMWHKLWPERKEDDVPITHITNGVHAPTWMARRLQLLFDHYLGSDWREHIDDPDVWSLLDSIPDAELWAVRRHLKNKLVSYCNRACTPAMGGGRFSPGPGGRRWGLARTVFIDHRFCPALRHL